MTVYGYARVSTKRQINGNSFEEQKALLESEGCETIVCEQFSGATTCRPELDKLISKLQSGDTLVVTKLDRLSRTVQEGSKLIQDLVKKDVTVVRACKIFCVKSKSWYNHFIQNGGLQNGKKETQPCKCSRYRPYF